MAIIRTTDATPNMTPRAVRALRRGLALRAPVDRLARSRIRISGAHIGVACLSAVSHVGAHGPVDERDGPAHARRYGRIVSDHGKRRAATMHALQEVQDHPAARDIERAGRLVRQHYLWPVG